MKEEIVIKLLFFLMFRSRTDSASTSSTFSSHSSLLRLTSRSRTSLTDPPCPPTTPTSSATSSDAFTNSSSVDSFEARSIRMMKKKTKMVFYMQDWESGKNVTAVPVAGRNGTLSSILNYATVMVVDDAITEGQDRQSKQIGRAQGIYVNSALDASDLHLLFSIVFTNEKYNASTIEIQGADRFFLKQREVSVVSGTGYFRFAQGFAVLETVYLDLASLNAVIKFNVTIHHY